MSAVAAALHQFTDTDFLLFGNRFLHQRSLADDFTAAWLPQGFVVKSFFSFTVGNTFFSTFCTFSRETHVLFLAAIDRFRLLLLGRDQTTDAFKDAASTVRTCTWNVFVTDQRKCQKERQRIEKIFFHERTCYVSGRGRGKGNADAKSPVKVKPSRNNVGRRCSERCVCSGERMDPVEHDASAIAPVPVETCREVVVNPFVNLRFIQVRPSGFQLPCSRSAASADPEKI